MKSSDPAAWMLTDGHTSTPVVHKQGCPICEDPEYAQMGLPLCRRCPVCGGHIAADDTVCDDCGLDDMSFWEAVREDETAYITFVHRVNVFKTEAIEPPPELWRKALTAFERECALDKPEHR